MTIPFYSDDNCKLFHGDCLEEMRSIPDGSIDMICTDPPYGTTACKWDSVIPLEPMWEQLKRVIKPNGAICLFGSEPFSSHLRLSNLKQYKYDWIWYKNRRTGFQSAKYMPMKSIENISVFYSNSGSYFPQKTKRLSSKGGKNSIQKAGEVYGNSSFKRSPQSNLIHPHQVIDFIKSVHSSEKRFHPTQKPVPLMEYLIKTYTNEGETVLDFTMGSGTTGVACKNLNRDFIGIELDLNYCEIAVKRIKPLSKTYKQIESLCPNDPQSPRNYHQQNFL